MSEQTVIELETLPKSNDKTSLSSEGTGSQHSTHVSFKSAAMVTMAAASAAKKPDKISWIKKRSSSKQLSLDHYMYDETVPIHTLAADGKLEELKSAIKEHELTLKETDNNGYTLLHHATLHNQEQVMLFLIDSGVELDAVDNEGNTALHLAAEKDFAEACHVLLANGASDTILNKEILAPLHLAAVGRNKALKAILDHPVVNGIEGVHNRTPLHTICEHDNIEGLTIFNEMVVSKIRNDKNSSVKVCSTDANGLTPMHLAARKNSFRCLDFIIRIVKERGLTAEQALSFIDEENSTPLHAAVDSCNFEVAEVLLKHGASPVTSNGDLIPPLHMACSQGRSDMVRMMVEHAGPEIIVHTDQQQKTPLHYCALSIHSSCMIPFLVEKGKGLIVIDAQDEKGRTPLHNAVTSANLAGTKELLSYGANPLKTDNKGLNALHIAVSCNRKVIVNALLELPCATELVSHTCCRGNSAIHHALHVGQGEVIPKMIAALQFEVQRCQDEKGNNYLHLAARKGNIKALKALLEVPEIHKMLNETNKWGQTPLHSAAVGGHYRCIDILLNNGAMFHKTRCGKTAFMIACIKGFTDCAKLLLQAHPSQIGMTDNDGTTPLHAAALSKTPSMVTLLLDQKCSLALNHDERTFFDIIIDSADFDCAMAVINHDRWQECLDFSSPSHRNPMIGLIEQMPKVAKAVLDRCHSKATNLDKSHPDYWETYDFKYLYSQKTNQSAVRQGLAYAINPTAVHPQLVDEGVAAVKYKDQSRKSVTHESSVKKRCKREVCYGQETMKVVQEMKRFKRQDLLIHPVVNAFLESKWRRYGNAYFYIEYFLQLLMTVFLSAFVLIVPNPSKPGTLITAENGTEPEVPPLETRAQVLRAFSLTMDLLFFIFIIYNLVIHFRRRGGYKVFFSVSVWFSFLSLFTNFIFFAFPNPLTIWPLAAVSCFFSWFTLLLTLEHSSIPGTIVKMFLEVTKTVFLVLFVSLFALFAFAFAFYVLAGGLSEFDHVGYSFLSVFGFMLGELPYDMYVKQNVAENLPNGNYVLILILVLAILLSIVLANLLIGLAVGDIERVKLNAILQRKAIEIEFFSQIDTGIPSRYLKRFSLPSYTTYPNKNRSICTIWRDSWKWIEAQIESEETDTQTATNNATVTSEIKELKSHVLELKETIQQMQEANAEFRRRHRSLSARSSMSSFEFYPGEEPTSIDSGLEF